MMEDKEFYTTEELIKKFESLRPHIKTLKMIAKNAKKEVFDDVEIEIKRLDKTKVRHKNWIHKVTLNKIKKKHLEE